ncbi:MAG: hypothetical protein RMK45_02655 [Armatimonadota bacterium]|nr:hypothetical protein [Armatimonadota bacterium]
MKGKRLYRVWMAILLVALMGLIPLHLWLRTLSQGTVADKRLWLLLAGVTLVAAFALLLALLWLALQDLRYIAEQYRREHREAFMEMTEQIRAAYHRRRQEQEQARRNGAQQG